MAKVKVSWNFDDLLNTVNAGNVNEVDEHGFAPVHYVAGSGGLKLIKALKDLGANLDLYTVGDSDNKPLTPLVVAIKNGKVAAANLLLEQGANPDLLVDNLGPWAYAIRHKTLAPELISVLILNKANISKLHQIIEKFGPDILQRLEVGPDLIEKVVFSINGGAENLLHDYFSKDIDPTNKQVEGDAGYLVEGNAGYLVEGNDFGCLTARDDDDVEVRGELSDDYKDDF